MEYRVQLAEPGHRSAPFSNPVAPRRLPSTLIVRSVGFGQVTHDNFSGDGGYCGADHLQLA